MPRRTSSPRDRFTDMFSYCFLVLVFLLLGKALARPSPHPQTALSTTSPRTPLVMLSTMDGTVAAFDARTGATLFTHNDPRPAVDSWAAPGVPEFVPSLEGMLYRVDPVTEEVHLIDGKFINARRPLMDKGDTVVPAQTTEEGADAVVLTSEDSSLLYIDLRSGRVLKELSYSSAPPTEPILPQLSDAILVVSRTMVGVKVKNADTGVELANATLVHTLPTFLERGKCVVKGDEEDNYVAYVNDARDRLTVRSMRTGNVLWSKEVATPVVEAHGMGGVRIAEKRGDAEKIGRGDEVEALGEGESVSDVILKKNGKHVFAMLAGPEEEMTGAEVQRYKVNGGMDLRTVGSRDRLLGRGRLPTRKEREMEGDVFVITSREAGLAAVAMIVVGVFGFVVGRRPRRKRRRKRRVVLEEEREEEERVEEEEEDEDEVRRYVLPARVSNEERLESNGSTGSGGGFVSNRSESGWMNVGCLCVSNKVLGVGSHGTVVYEGKITPGERKVAVKRLLRQFFESARKEISLLVELDEASPHVVRYFAMEEDSEFIYLALELCAASLAERVTERLPPVPPGAYVGGPPPMFTSRALRQLLQGLADLHRVGVVHRDVKPQNVLITRANTGMGDIKLADVGLALRLAANRSSYTAVTNAGGGVGTTGWRAPEVLSGGRQTKAVDIFAAGCVVCFVLTGGDHPFGNDIFRRDGNIAMGNPTLEALEELELPEATDIVKKMIDPVASQRPSAEEALRHPFFWTDAMKLAFLVDISDRLYDTRHHPARYTENLDRYPRAQQYCSDWLVKMDMELLMGLGRGYENTASGLLRVIRNKRNHYSELSSSLQKLLGPLPQDKHRPDGAQAGPEISQDSDDGTTETSNFLTYFTSKVPELLMCVYQYAIENPVLIDQPHFSRYGLQPSKERPVLPIHPLVRKARAARADPSTPSGLVEIDKERNGFVGEADTEQRRSFDDEQTEADPIQDCDEPSSDDEVIVTTRPNRRAYHRHELVAIQAMCPTMHPETLRRVMSLDIYQPTAYLRYRKRLATNEFDDADFDTPPDREAPQAPPGFQRIPKRQSQQGPPGFGPRAMPFMAHSPSSSRPPGFGTTPGQAHPPSHQRRNAGGIAPTVSQFSGEERVVDFGALRRRR